MTFIVGWIKKNKNLNTVFKNYRINMRLNNIIRVKLNLHVRVVTDG